LIAKSILHAIGGEIAILKWQKPCDFDQTEYLAFHRIPLFPENFERWDNSPVCRELLNMHHGWCGISEEDILSDFSKDEALSEQEFDRGAQARPEFRRRAKY
jgi:uncharacterized phage-associated protein